MQSFKALLQPTLETERLTLHLFDYSAAHYDCLLAAVNSPASYRAMGDLGLRTPAQFDALNASTRLHPSALGRDAATLAVDTDVYYLLRVKGDTHDASGQAPLIGGLSLTQRNPRIPPDAGWCLLEAWHGHGYAAEAARALIAHMTALGAPRMIAWPGRENIASCRTAERAGFVFGGEMANDSGETEIIYMLPGTDFASFSGERLSLFGEGAKQTSS